MTEDLKQRGEKYNSFTPYNYVLGNPIILVDIDGNEVKPGSAYDLKIIQKTVPVADAKYIQIDKTTGMIDKTLLLSHKSKSANYNSLVTLATDSKVVMFQTGAKSTTVFKDAEGKTITKRETVFGEKKIISNKEEIQSITTSNDYYNLLPNGNLETTTSEVSGETIVPMELNGVTAGPESGDISVTVADKLSEGVQVENAAHELIHALLYIQGKSSTHKYEPNSGLDGNNQLRKKIKESTDEAKKNYLEHTKTNKKQ